MTDQPADPRPARRDDADWRDGVVYQIYPRSFADRDGNGTGDLRGISTTSTTSGPTACRSTRSGCRRSTRRPGRDLGYDVTDHTAVDPLLGTEADFDRLVAACHERGIKVILDLVMNHTSDEHAWFLASKASREGPYADFYLWRDPRGCDADGNPLPPNNWVSFFGGPGWEWVPERRQFYYHTFLVGQPELNWRNPAVEAAQWDMVRGWLDRGVDGFRLDVFNAFLKDPELRDNPVIEGDSPWTRLEHRYDIDQPDFPELIGRFRAIVDERPGRMSVGELFSRETELAASTPSDRHHRVRLVADGIAVDGRGVRRGDRPARGGLRPGPSGRRSRSRTTTASARRPACRRRSGAIATRTATRSPRPRPSSILALARHAVPLLRRGDRDDRRRHPARRDRRSAGAPGRAGLPVVRPLALPDADAVAAGPGRRLHDRPAVAPAGAGRRPAQRGGPGRGSRTPSSRPTAGCSRSGGRPPALRTGAMERLETGDPGRPRLDPDRRRPAAARRRQLRRRAAPDRRRSRRRPAAGRPGSGRTASRPRSTTTASSCLRPDEAVDPRGASRRH